MSLKIKLLPAIFLLFSLNLLARGQEGSRFKTRPEPSVFQNPAADKSPQNQTRESTVAEIFQTRSSDVEPLPTENQTEVDPSIREANFNDVEQVRDDATLSQANIEEFALTMHDFSQSLMFEMWNEGDNFVFSPFSLHSALAILTSGASPNTSTENELLDALGRVRNVQALENRYNLLIQDYSSTNVSSLLSFGNRFWTEKKYFEKISGYFLERLSSIYEVQFQVFGPDPAKDVNDWVSNVTDGKITRIVDMVSPTLAFLIVNALHFKASWTIAFEDVPEPQDFMLDDDKTILKIPMMRRDFSYQFKAAKFETGLLPQGFNEMLVLSIPYEYDFGERFEMVIVMPSNPKALNFLQATYLQKKGDPSIENIFDSAFEALAEKQKGRNEYTVTMPRFTIDSSISAGDYFRKIGINAAFDEGGFSRIINDEAFKVGQIKHRATIEVTKDGTIGAAASAIEIVKFSAVVEAPKEILINKPFLFYVHDKAQRVILFAGKYTNPNM